MKNRSSLLTICIVFSILLLIILGCRSRGGSLSSDSRDYPARRETSTTDSCPALWKRIDELDNLIVRNEDELKHANEQAKRTCRRTESSVECNMWTSAGMGYVKNIRDFKYEKSKIQNQISQAGCN